VRNDRKDVMTNL